MNPERQQAYLQLIETLLQCPQGQEEAVFITHSALIDEGLVATANAVAQDLAERNDPTREPTIKWLREFAQNLTDKLVDLDGGEQATFAQEQFLLQVFAKIADSEGDPEVIYPIFKANLALLDSKSIEILQHLAAELLLEPDAHRRRASVDELNCLARLLQEFPHGNRAINLELAIVSHQAALTVVNQTALPMQWADIQNNLAYAYSDRMRGDRAENLELAISGYLAILEIYHQRRFPTEWGTIQHNLANAYYKRIKGDRAENLELALATHQAALKVRTRSDFPTAWANTQNNLANIYGDRIQGDRAENLELAISSYNAALEVYNQTDFPVNWAAIQHNLANTYRDRIQGDRSENLELAIFHCAASLTICTQADFPIKWANTQTSLAAIYLERIADSPAENMRLAIAYNEAAQTIFTPTTDPVKWAEIQVLFGKIFTKLAEQSGSEDHHTTAYHYYQAALTVYTPTADPKEWANVQLALANLSIQHQQDYQVAAEYLNTAADQLLEHKSDTNLLPKILFELGRCLHRAGYLEQAKIHFKDCIRLYQRLDSQPQIAAATFALGNVEIQMGHLEPARLHLETALVFYQGAENPEADTVATTERVQSINDLLRYLPTPEPVVAEDPSGTGLQQFGLRTNPFHPNPPSDLTQIERIFYGRERELAQILESLNAGENVLIRGACGIGKTATVGNILAKLQQTVADSDAEMLVILIECVPTATAIDFYRSLLLALTQQLAPKSKEAQKMVNQLTAPPSGATDDPNASDNTDDIYQQLLLWLQVADRIYARVAIVVENVDRQNPPVVQEILEQSQDLFSQGNHRVFIMTGRSFTDLQDATIQYLGIFSQDIKLESMGKEDLHQITINQLNSARIQPSDNCQPFTDAALDRLIVYAQGIPRQLNLICEQMLLVAADGNYPEIDNEAIEALFPAIQDRLIQNLSPELRHCLYAVYELGGIDEDISNQSLDRLGAMTFNELVPALSDLQQLNLIIKVESDRRWRFVPSHLVPPPALVNSLENI